MGYKQEFEKKFRVQELKIFDAEYWIWSIRPEQVTIGSGILSLKRECLTFSDLTQEEFTDLYNIIGEIEKALKTAFDYDIMNYLMLMMVDKQVHYHVIPRYESLVEFSGVSWKDNGWPGPPNLLGEELSNDTLEEIRLEITKNL